jgi:tRNA(Glu) U13 pseudouridine synthase TruD
MNPAAFATSGIKDKEAITFQQVCVRAALPTENSRKRVRLVDTVLAEDLLRVNGKVQGVERLHSVFAFGMHVLAFRCDHK